VKRIDTATRAQNLFGSGRDGFRDGSTPGTAPTDLNAAWFNTVQEEVARAIETHGIGIEDTSYSQLGTVIELQRMAVALSAMTKPTTTGSTSGILGVATCSNAQNWQVRDLTASQPWSSWAAVKANTFIFNDVALGSITANLTAVAMRYSGLNTPVAVAVGSDGKWYRVASGSVTGSGTIGGAPNLQEVVWDPRLQLWWAVGPGGIWKSADGASLSWSQLSATQHDRVAAGSSRTLFFRPSDTRLYYTDDGSALTAGATIGSAITQLLWDPRGAQFVSGGMISANGTTATTGAGLAARLFCFRNRVCLFDHQGGGSEFGIFGLNYADAFTLSVAYWQAVAFGTGSVAGDRIVAGGGSQVIVANANGIWLSAKLPDIYTLSSYSR